MDEGQELRLVSEAETPSAYAEVDVDEEEEFHRSLQGQDRHRFLDDTAIFSCNGDWSGVVKRRKKKREEKKGKRRKGRKHLDCISKQHRFSATFDPDSDLVIEDEVGVEAVVKAEAEAEAKAKAEALWREKAPQSRNWFTSMLKELILEVTPDSCCAYLASQGAS